MENSPLEWNYLREIYSSLLSIHREISVEGMAPNPEEEFLHGEISRTPNLRWQHWQQSLFGLKPQSKAVLFWQLGD